MTTELRLLAATPFSLSAVVSSHGWVQLAPFEQTEEGTFAYVTRLNGGHVLRFEAAPVDGGVCVATDADLTETQRAELAQQVHWMVGLDQNLGGFYTLACEHPKLAHMAANARGRLLRSPTLFEDVVKTILTTNTSWAGTRRMAANVVAQFGEPSEGDEARQAFPAPERLAVASEGVLRQETGLGYRAPYVLELAQAVTSGALALEGLKDSGLPTSELRKELLRIKGVGSYAAANLLLILGHYDHIPIDSWALRVVSQEWHGGEAIGAAEVEAAFEKWGEWKGLVYWFWEWTEA